MTVQSQACTHTHTHIHTYIHTYTHIRCRPLSLAHTKKHIHKYIHARTHSCTRRNAEANSRSILHHLPTLPSPRWLDFFSPNSTRHRWTCKCSREPIEQTQSCRAALRPSSSSSPTARNIAHNDSFVNRAIPSLCHNAKIRGRFPLQLFSRAATTWFMVGAQLGPPPALRRRT